MKINIRDRLASVFQWLKEYIRETRQLPYFRLYVILVPLFLFVFLVVTFPYDVIVRRSLLKIEGGAVRNITMGELEVPLFGMWSTRSLTATLRDDGTLSIKEANLDLSLIRFLAGRYLGGLQFTSCRIQKPSMTVDLNGSCNFDLKKAGPSSVPVDGTVRIILDNVLLRLGTINLPDNMGGLPIDVPPCKLSSLILKAELKGSKITIREANVSGNDLRGSVTGSIDIQGAIQNSNLDLTVSLDADSAAIAKFRPFLSGMTNGKGKIDFTIRGNLSRPKVEALQGSRNMSSDSPSSTDSMGLSGPGVPAANPSADADED